MFEIIDIKFGDIVILRNSEKYVMADNHLFGEYGINTMDCHSIFIEYKTNLYHNYASELDIVKVIRDGKTVYERGEN